MEALDRYVASSSSFAMTNSLLADHGVSVLVNKNSPRRCGITPRNLGIIRRRPEGPLLTLLSLPTNPFSFMAGTHLTQERYDSLD
jgi:hypothetical protein